MPDRCNLKLLFFLTFVWSLFQIPFDPAAAFMRRRAPLSYINCQKSLGFMGDSANTALGFSGGTATGITWDGSKMVLNPATTSGTFISRIIDNACIQLSPWLNFKWKTSLPFGKELSASSESNSDYSALAPDLMNGLIGIWRFNEASYNGTANEVIDSSGNGNHGVLEDDTAWTQVQGRFNRSTNRTSSVGRLMISAATLPNNTHTFSFSTWFKSSSPNTWAALVYRGNRIYTAGLANSWSLRINNLGYLYVQIDTSAEWNQTVVYAPTPILDGRWHHLAMTVTSSSVALYLDGAKYTDTYLIGAGLSGDWPLELAEFDGNMDEAVYWNRVLSDSEVVNLYRRGANQVKIQIRNCSNSDCSDNPTWRGPDNSALTFFTELNNNSNPVTMLGTVLTSSAAFAFSSFPGISLTKRYFQYKLILETDNTSYRPDVQLIGPGR